MSSMGGQPEALALGEFWALHAAKVHVEVAIGLAAEGGTVAAQSVGFDMAAFVEHGFSLTPPGVFVGVSLCFQRFTDSGAGRYLYLKDLGCK